MYIIDVLIYNFSLMITTQQYGNLADQWNWLTSKEKDTVIQAMSTDEQIGWMLYCANRISETTIPEKELTPDESLAEERDRNGRIEWEYNTY